MTVLLLMVAVYTILGGMLSVLVTDFLQFVVMSLGLLRRDRPDPRRRSAARRSRTPWTDTTAPAGFNPFAQPGAGLGLRLFNACLNARRRAHLADRRSQRVLAAKDATTGQKVYTRTASSSSAAS